MLLLIVSATMYKRSGETNNGEIKKIGETYGVTEQMEKVRERDR